MKSSEWKEELAPEATHKKIFSVRQEVSRQVQRELDYYNLDMIISVGYRVKSLIATRFRIWATQRLREHIVKGFAMDDERLKQAGGGGYFEELLARIRSLIGEGLLAKGARHLRYEYRL